MSVAYASFVSFSVALATLLLQLVQTRIYGVIYWNHLVYFIISVALLGFGISGTWLSFGRDNRLARFLTLPRAATGFIVSTLLASLLVPQIGLSISAIFQMKYLAGLFATYVFAVLPYFFAGWMLGSLFRDYIARIHTLYFADLVGSAVGCFLFLAGMQPLGAVVLVLVSCLAIGAPILLAHRSTPLKIPGLWAAVLLALALVPAGSAINARIVPESTKAFMNLYANLQDGDEKVWEFSEWNPISRIDVVGHTKSEAKEIFIDGDAWTGFMWMAEDPIRLHDLEGWPPLIDHRAPYYLIRNPEHVLVIGTGGGVDILEALRGGAKNVDAIEINPTTYRILHEEYREAGRELGDRPGVETYNEEGRSFIRRTDKQYDVIMLHGIDTFAAINAGAYVLSENYLYTVDAMKDYISHLTDGGILCINRWYHYAETPRLFSVCLEALYELGVEDPERHIMLHGQDWGTIMVRKTPFSQEQITAFQTYVESLDEKFADRFVDRRKAEFIYPRTDTAALSDVARTVGDYAASRKAGTQVEYLQSLAFDISPVYDDSPFFFHFDRFSDFLAVFRNRNVADWVRGNWPSFTLFGLLGFTTAAVLLFMFVPLMRSGRAQIPLFGAHLTYFACLGVSFIFVEIALMQRFALLLGHPSRSLALVLAGLLFFAGVGSQIAGSSRTNLRVLLPILVALIVGTTFLYPTLILIALPWPLYLRGLFTLALVAPLGILMGMPFPTGLNLTSRWGETAVPWMWGVNGGTTVLGSVIAIVLAIHLGFTTVLLVAAAGYALAWLMFLRIANPALGKG